ncbi:MAG: mechanosensitive ion channel domain-containing protein [Pseudomonadota bacterium]
MQKAITNWAENVPGLAGFAEEFALVAAVFLVLVLAAVVYLISRQVFARFLRRLFTGSGSIHDKILVEHKLFERLSHLAPAVFLNIIGPEVFEASPEIASFFDSASLIYITIALVIFVDTLIDALLAIYNTYDFARDIPLTSIAQASKLLLYFVAIVLVLSLSLGESLNTLLASLGALTAGAAFVFKDAILGFVAGLQLTSNSMVAVGDWIEAPDLGVDGDVLEIGMTTVKVRNFDRTITTFPTHALISGSFKNWRGMTETGGRRIKRAILIDFSSVKFCDAQMLERLSQINLITDYLMNKQEEIVAHNRQQSSPEKSVINGRRLTNIGVLRVYLEAYLRAHPDVRTDLMLLVRQLAPRPEGLPIEVYAFANTTDWKRYEAVQADIFDHIIAAVNEFDLKLVHVPPGS